MLTLLLLAGCGSPGGESPDRPCGPGDPGCDVEGCDGQERYRDADGDGHGAGRPSASCGAGWVPDALDCDDSDAAVHPGARETCDVVDQDCDGEVDEAGSEGEEAWFEDADGDGWGGATQLSACWRPPGHVAVGGDCDDDDDATRPGAPELDCDDPVDRNCDGSVGREDADGDGAFACRDCDDRRPDRGPEADETCDGEDDDCDGEVDEGDAVDAVAFYPDEDLDGWGAAGEPAWSCSGGPRLASRTFDCDDRDPAVNPGRAEDCATPHDDDCDADENDDGAVGCRAWIPDADGDGWGGAEVCTCTVTAPLGHGEDDCDDAHATAHPGGGEVCGNGVDEDCAGSAKCGFAGDVALDAAAAWVVGAGPDAALGGAVAALDDLDGDGIAELAVSVLGAEGGEGGGAWVVASSEPLGAAPWAVLRGEPGVMFTEERLAAVGDTDGDGVGDLAVSAPKAGSSAGSVYVVSGAALRGEVSLADHGVRDGELPGDDLGQAIFGPGDVNGDGHADLVMAAKHAHGVGAVYLYHGPIGGRTDTTDASATVRGEREGDRAGAAVGGGDLDGDGFADLVVGASAVDLGAGTGGAAYVLYGPIAGDVSLGAADAVVLGGERSGMLGKAVATGDIDGDGLPDLAVGAPHLGTRADLGGGVYLFAGPLVGALTTGDATAWFVGAPEERAGAVMSLTDLDADGLADLVVRGNLDSPRDGVRVFVAPLEGALADVSSVWGSGTDALGVALAPAGDTDGDGFGDLWLGAPGYGVAMRDQGAAFLFLGGPGE